MPRLHQITHDNELIRKKVNFFADYFCFAAETIGYNDALEIENPLSLVEKIIFQITKNPTRCVPYIDSYLTHPSFWDYDDLEKFKSFKDFQVLLAGFNASKGLKLKSKWLHSNPQFLKVLEAYRRDLKRSMFKTALGSIISYLRCDCDMDEHKKDLIAQTNLIVSEFILNNHSKKDIEKIFQKIMTKEVGIFPFPKGLTRPDEKEVFIKNRTFQQQFDGIYNVLKKDLVENHFIFRIYGLKAPDDFLFKYNKVTFYSPKHKKLKRVIASANDHNLIKHFFDNNEYLILAVVKAEYGSIDIARNEAVEIINTELQRINLVVGANCRLEKFSYLLTSDFVNVGWSWDGKEQGYKIIGNEIDKLNDNPYSFLRNSARRYKDTLLQHESIYTDALVNKNVSTFWQYLETIIPPTHNDDKQVIDVVSDLLLLNAETHHRNRLEGYLVDATSPFNVSAKHLGIPVKQQVRIGRDAHKLNWEKLGNEFKPLFLNHLAREFITSFDKQDLLKRQAAYKRVLHEAQAQRNAIIHKGIANEKSLITLNGQLPRLISRLRWILFEGIRQKEGNDYADVINNLRAKAAQLLQ